MQFIVQSRGVHDLKGFTDNTAERERERERDDDDDNDNDDG